MDLFPIPKLVLETGLGCLPMKLKLNNFFKYSYQYKTHIKAWVLFIMSFCFSAVLYTTFSKPHMAGITGKAGSAGVAGADAPNSCNEPVISVLPSFSDIFFSAKF